MKEIFEAWLKAKEAHDKATENLSVARQALEEAYPKGTEKPFSIDNLLVQWQKATTFKCPDPSILPKSLTKVVLDTDKVKAYKALGIEPHESIKEEIKYSLVVKEKK